MSIISTDIKKAVRLLDSDDVVAIPTETVYGLAANIYSSTGIKKIFQVKKRPLYNPLIAHVDTIAKVEEIVLDFPTKARKLAEAFWPGSLTLVLKKNKKVPDLITAGKDTVAVRIPNHNVTLALLRELDYPLAAPSANPFGNISPTNATHVESYFENDIPMVLDGGACKNGIESTIVGFENNNAVIYRFGAISIEDIVDVIGPVAIRNKEEKTPAAPGMLGRHYAPRTKTYLVKNIDTFLEEHKKEKVGIIKFSEDMKISENQHLEILSKEGDLKEAASILYHTLHRMDKLDLDIIVAELFPNEGLGKSINDRLERATKSE